MLGFVGVRQGKGNKERDHLCISKTIMVHKHSLETHLSSSDSGQSKLGRTVKRIAQYYKRNKIRTSDKYSK